MSKLLGAHCVRSRGRAPRVIALAIATLAGACAQGGLNTAELNTVSRPEENAAKSDLAAQAKASSAGQVAALSAPESRMAQAEATGGSPMLAEARKLRQAGDKTRALELLDKAAQKDAKDVALSRERGMLALELGQVDKARTLLKKVVDAGPADWRTHSAYGAALSAGGRQQEAQLQFAKALEISPDQPSVLNNLALSYALDGKHDQAEGLLRRVALTKDADTRSKQNLALLLGLKGKQEEAQKVSAAVLPPEKARANVRMLQGAGDGAKPAAPAPEPRVPVASETSGGAVRAAAVAGAEPTYRLGGPRE